MKIAIVQHEPTGYRIARQERIRAEHATRPGAITPTDATFPKTSTGWKSAMTECGRLNTIVAESL